MAAKWVLSKPDHDFPSDTPLDEVYDTQMEVERNPCGAWLAIHYQADTITAQAAELATLKMCSDEAEREVAALRGQLAAAEARVAVLEGVAARVISLINKGSQRNISGDLVYRHGDGYARVSALEADARAALKGGE